jgi:AAA15 family ATPase/GTPase
MKKPLEFAPLTIFCGANSSGKSSILQSILLFKQTLQKTIESPNMVLNGPLVKLGDFSDVVSDVAGEKDKQTQISCAFQIDKYRYDSRQYDNGIKLKKDEKPESSISCEIDFTSDYTSEHTSAFYETAFFKEYYPIAVRINIKNLLNNDVNLTVKFEKDPDGQNSHHIVTENACFTEPFPRIREWPSEGYPVWDTVNFTKDYGAQSFNHFLPNVTLDQDAQKTYISMQDNIRKFFLENIFYLGPLRSEPQNYNNSNGSLQDVGCKGEYTAECYLVNFKKAPYDADRDYFTENGFEFKKFLKDSEPDTDSNNVRALEDSVASWMRYIGVAEGIEIAGDGELRVVQEGRERTLNNVGVGVSQVLPIIVQCLVAKPDSTIIIEQPELHLHPKMQSRLADFFLVMSLMGRQLIIETHSEYIIDKLRLRIVQAPLDKPINDKVAIYFAEKHNGASEFKRIKLNEFSVMSEWPEGFFEESISLAEEIFREARRKDQEWRENNKDTQNDLDDEDYDD